MCEGHLANMRARGCERLQKNQPIMTPFISTPIRISDKFQISQPTKIRLLLQVKTTNKNSGK